LLDGVNNWPPIPTARLKPKTAGTGTMADEEEGSEDFEENEAAKVTKD